MSLIADAPRFTMTALPFLRIQPQMKPNPPQLSEQQLAQLIGLGDCFIHTHPKETLGFTERQELMEAVPVTAISSTPYAITTRDEILTVDTTGGAVTINLPQASRGRELRVIRVAGSASVTLLPTGSDTLNGGASLVISSSYSPIHLKAIFGTGYITI